VSDFAVVTIHLDTSQVIRSTVLRGSASLDIAVAMARTEALNDIARSFGGLMSEIGPSLTNAQTKLLQQKLEAGSDESGECPDYNGVEYVCRAAPFWKQ
jgi:hypothetical protein